MRNEYDRDETSAATKLTYLLVGGGIGAVLALLFAPKSGQELRGDDANAERREEFGRYTRPVGALEFGRGRTLATLDLERVGRVPRAQRRSRRQPGIRDPRRRGNPVAPALCQGP